MERLVWLQLYSLRQAARRLVGSVAHQQEKAFHLAGKTTRRLTGMLPAFPADERASEGHLDVQDDLLLSDRRDEREPRQRRS